MPNGPLLIAAAAIPPIAGLFRVLSGGRQIDLNHCSARVRQLQGIALGLGLVPVIFLDCLFIACGAPAASAWPLIAAIYGFYFMAVIIAMYPGRTPSTEAAGLLPDCGDDQTS